MPYHSLGRLYDDRVTTYKKVLGFYCSFYRSDVLEARKAGCCSMGHRILRGFEERHNNHRPSPMVTITLQTTTEGNRRLGGLLWVRRTDPIPIPSACWLGSLRCPIA